MALRACKVRPAQLEPRAQPVLLEVPEQTDPPDRLGRLLLLLDLLGLQAQQVPLAQQDPPEFKVIMGRLGLKAFKAIRAFKA